MEPGVFRPRDFVIVRLIAFALIAEALFGALYLSNYLTFLATYDPVAIVLILSRGVIGALQFAGGWMLATRRPTGAVLARWGLIGGAAFMILAVGFNLAPSDVYHWYRWHVTAAYFAYAATAIWILRRA